MKKIQLIGMVMICLTMTMVSCSGDDGERGPVGPAGPQGEQGLQGPSGADGQDGVDGAAGADGQDGVNGVDGQDGADGMDGVDGQDGNANVQAFSYDVTLFADYTLLNLDLFNIVDNPENYAYLFYIEDVNGLRYSIPGNIAGLPLNVHVATNLPNGELTLLFFNDTDDSPYNVPGGFFTKVIVVAVELTNGAKTGDNFMADLKAAGVDTTDYHAIASYFGLE